MLFLGLCVVIIVLSVLGLLFDSFSFEGFLLVKSKVCKDKLLEIVKVSCICIFYELLYWICELL